eukprot:jgi/Tetstr1/444127/TSEL_032025.t1
MATKGRRFAASQWAHEQGCRWGPENCNQAARGGHLGLLQWARGQGCPWDAGECRDLAERKRHGAMGQRTERLLQIAAARLDVVGFVAALRRWVCARAAAAGWGGDSAADGAAWRPLPLVRLNG